MLGTEANGMTLCIMLTIYASKAKEECAKRSKESGHSDPSQLAMYAFYDAVHRTALAINQVLDAKRKPDEAYERLIDYATGLEGMLGNPDEEPDSVQEVD